MTQDLREQIAKAITDNRGSGTEVQADAVLEMLRERLKPPFAISQLRQELFSQSQSVTHAESEEK